MKTGNIVGFAALVFVSTVLLLCTQRAIDPYNSDLKDELQWKGSIAGTVLSDDSLPIAGVAVTVDSAGFSTVTDSLGRYRIPNVSAGTYRLSFTHAHYVDTTLNRTIELAQDQDIININTIIRRNPAYFPGSISGVLRNDAGVPVAGVLVTVDSTGATTTTDSLGRFTFSSIIAGTHKLTLTKANYVDSIYSGITVTMSTLTTTPTLIIRRNPSSFPGSINGFVRAPDSTKIKNVTVTIIGPGNTTTTDSLGAFTLSTVLPGTYAISFSHAHYYDTSITSITVGFNQQISGIRVIMRKNPLYFTGSIAGMVVDSATRVGANGVVIAATPGGYITTSDVNGHYQFDNLPFGTYSVTASLNHRSNTHSGIVVLENDTTTADTLFAMRQDVLPRDISGGLTGSTAQVNKIITTIRGDLIDSLNPVVRQLTWLPISKRYTGNVYIPDQGILFNAEVRVYNSSNRVIGYQRMEFDRGAATVSMPDFNAENALPIARAGADTLVSINDTIWLHGSAVDTFDVNGRRISPLVPGLQLREWAIGNTDLFVPASFDAFVIAPSTTNSAFTCVLRVTDNDGNIAIDTIKTSVILDAPVVNAGPDTVVTIGDTIRLHGTVTNVFGTIVSNSWDIGATGTFRPSRKDTIVIAPASANADYKCIMKAVDDDGNSTTDTLSVTILQAPPRPNAGRDTMLSINDVLLLHGSTTDTMGGTITAIAWDIGATGVFRASRYDTAITLPTSANNSYKCILRVTDNDGNIVLDSMTVNVVLDAPVVNAGRDTAVAMGSVFYLHGLVTQSFGTITNWEWSINGGAFLVSKADTVITMPSVYRSSYPCYLRVTDDDGNVAVDTVVLTSGAAWAVAGTTGLSALPAHRTVLRTFASTNIISSPSYIYLGYCDFDGTGTYPHVKRWNGSQWDSASVDQWLPAGTTKAAKISIAFNFSNNVTYESPMPYYSICKGIMTPDTLKVQTSTTADHKWGSWFKLTSSAIDVSISQYGTYCAVLDGGSVNVYNGPTSLAPANPWTLTGGVAASAADAAVRMDMAYGYAPYVAYITGALGSNHTVYVKRWSGSSWVQLGSTWLSGDNGLSGGIDDCNQVPITTLADTPYVAYSDPNNSKKISVKKYQSSTWSTVGSAGFSQGAATDIAITASGGRVYVAYVEKNISTLNSITVKMFDGINWVTVGTAQFAPDNQFGISIAVYNGAPFVSLKDAASIGGKVTVYRLQ